MKSYITIPNPCDADWNKMLPNETGRHCELCNKTVVDFTKMSDNEIKNYFLKNISKKTCGHFYKGQLKNDKTKTQQRLINLYAKAYHDIKTKSVRLIVLFLLSGLLTLTGCNTPTDGEIIEMNQKLSGDSIAVIPSDTIKHNTIKNGL